jgi:CheY-like chemotaxis protein
MNTHREQNTDNRRERLLVLIVDDDRDFARDLAVLLQPCCDVLHSPRSCNGMELLMHERPDCVLLDIQMDHHFGNDRRTEGLAFLTALRTHPAYSAARQTPVVLISGSYLPGSQVDIETLGADAFFLKPLDVERLTKCIHELQSH